MKKKISTQVVFTYLLAFMIFFKTTFLENYDRYETQFFRVD